MTESIEELKKTIEEKNKIINDLEEENKSLKAKLDEKGNDENNNIKSIYSKVKEIYMEFQDYVSQLEESKELLFKNKFIEYSEKESNEKSKIFEEKFLKFFSLEGDQKNEAEEVNKVLQMRYNQIQKELENLKKLLDDKEQIIKTQKETEEQLKFSLNQFARNNCDLEMSFNKMSVDFKVREDELEFILLILQAVCEKKKTKYERALNKLTPDTKSSVIKIISNYNIF